MMSESNAYPAPTQEKKVDLAKVEEPKVLSAPEEKKVEEPKQGFLRTNNGQGGVELFHADIEEEKIRVLGVEKVPIMGKEKEVSPSVVNVRLVLWDVDENGEARIDPETNKPKTITIEKYVKSIDIEKSLTIVKFGESKGVILRR